MRLLVVEDHPKLGPQLKKGLERCHYLVDLVGRGEEALARERDVPYNLIILDIMLPGLSGREVCRPSMRCWNRWNRPSHVSVALSPPPPMNYVPACP
jgi:DNA-binding response OmpR family regulator